MKLYLGIIIYSALAATIMAQKDFSKCSLKYLRQVAKESCERIHHMNRTRRHVHNFLASENKDAFDFTSDHRFKVHQPIIPRHSIPAGATFRLRRSKAKRDTYDVNDMSSKDWVFYFCCDHMNMCESLPCEIHDE